MRKFLIFFVAIATATQYNDRVLLRDITALSFKQGIMTNGRRNPPILQLSCESGSCGYGPNNVLCENAGFDGNNIVWKCTGFGLANGYKLTHSDVGCEGYDSPDDPYILTGSCGVFYGVERDNSVISTVPIPPTTTTTTTTTVTHSYNPFSYFFYDPFFYYLHDPFYDYYYYDHYYYDPYYY